MDSICNGIFRIVIITTLLTYVEGRTKDVKQTNAINLIENLLNRSDNRVRPNVYGDPLDVQCDFYIQGLGPINEVDMEFDMQIYFRQRWVDSRMAFTEQKQPVIITPAHMNRLWVPDLFFPNEKSADFHEVTVPNKIIKIFPNGLIRYSARINLRLACNMLLLHFPLDHQRCSIKISSYSYDESDVRLLWLNTTNAVEYEEKKLLLPQFELQGITPENCKEKLTTGTFSCLEAVFKLKRQVGFYVLQTYVPSILIVSLSWVSFWISTDAVPARITLGVTTVLTMTTQLSTSRSNQMRVSYPKALDVWYALCMLFVFAALLEFAIVNIASRRDEKRRNRTSEAPEPEPEVAPASDDTKEEEEEVLDKNDEKSKGRQRRRMRRRMKELGGRVQQQYSTIYVKGLTASGIDKASRIIFPSSFVLFNFVYWVVYTQPIVFEVFR